MQNSPSAYVLGRVTLLTLFVVNLSDSASEVTGFNAVQANVETLAVVGVRELGMGYSLTLRVDLLILRAFETVLGFLCRKKESL